MIEDTTENTLPSHEEFEGGEAAVSEAVNLKDLMHDITGKEFPDDETARKSLQDTYKSVSEAKQYENAVKKMAEEKGVDPKELLGKLSNESVPQKGDFVTREEYEEAMFYSKHEDMVPYKDILGALRSQTGKSLQEVVQMDSFKDMYSKVKAHEENESAKSVLHSNPRLTKASDKITEARENMMKAGQAAQSGDTATMHRLSEAATKAAVNSVREAFEY